MIYLNILRRNSFLLVKYFQGNRSPLGVQRIEEGSSRAWAHHIVENKHHFQHWLDITEQGEVIPVEMPFRYALELVCDSIAAAKVYKGVPLDRKEPLRHWEEKVNKELIHPETAKIINQLFENYVKTGKVSL